MRRSGEVVHHSGAFLSSESRCTVIERSALDSHGIRFNALLISTLRTGMQENRSTLHRSEGGSARRSSLPLVFTSSPALQASLRDIGKRRWIEPTGQVERARQALLLRTHLDRGRDRDRFAALSFAHCRHANRKIPRGDRAIQLSPVSHLVTSRPKRAWHCSRARKWLSVRVGTITVIGSSGQRRCTIFNEIRNVRYAS
jgi:hypothetical protein